MVFVDGICCDGSGLVMTMLVELVGSLKYIYLRDRKSVV